MGKPLSITGEDSTVKLLNKVYRQGNFNNVDFRIVDNVNKYGDCYEYLYLDNKKIKSKLISPDCAYPVYSDNGEYIAFIEHWKDALSSVFYYNVFYADKVEEWNNAGGKLIKVNEYVNISGLPIHYHNINDYDELFGRSELKDIIPILDEMEDLLSKLGDSVYTNSMNPMPIVIGQRIDSSIDADAMGYLLNLEDGADFKYANASMDYNSIKLLYDNLKQHLLDISCMPSVAMGNSNVANVSEISLKLLYQLADVKAMLNEKCIRVGLYERLEVIEGLFKRLGINVDCSEIDVVFNYSRPVNVNDIMDNMKKQYEMGAISKQTIIENSELTNNVSKELVRLKGEDVKSEGKGDNINN